MPQLHKVEQGDCIATIAAQYGFLDWHVIYDHPLNAQLKRCRPNPNILYPGDAVHIPDKKLKTESRGTSSLHTFVVPHAKVLVRLAVEDSDNKAYANKKYLLKVDNNFLRGQTDSNGLIEQQIDTTAKQGELTVWLDDAGQESVSFVLQIGSLDPLDTISGVQGRLNNLGYDCGAVSGKMNDSTTAALIAFQKKMGLQATGEIDAATRSKLHVFHDTL